MQMGRQGLHPGVPSLFLMPMIDLQPSDEICIYSTMYFTSEQAKPLLSHLTSHCGWNHWIYNNLKPPIRTYNLKVRRAIYGYKFPWRNRKTDGRNWIARGVRGYIC